MMTRRTTFRLYPSQSEAALLFEARRLHRYLYNACVEHRQTSYRVDGKSVGYFDQQNALPAFKKVWPEYAKLGAHSLQATVKRVDLAYSSFFKGLRGYPKFKSIRHYSGWTYPDKQSWSVDSHGANGYLSLNDLGIKIQMRGTARTWGRPTTCTIVYRHGKWYASITVQCVPVRESGDGALGIDLGCKEAVTFSDGVQVSKPVFISEGERAVKLASRSLRRKRRPDKTKRVRGSRRWKKMQSKVSKLRRKVGRQRLDWMHQLTSNIVRGNSLIAGEKLNVKGMTRKARKGKRKRQKAGLNRSILEVGMSAIGKMLGYKEAEAGGFYVESPTRTLKPSQRCVMCWQLTPKTLSDRIHNCINPQCGHTEDRDVNAAQVNLAWVRGQELASPDADGKALPSSPVNTGGFRQLHHAKRQKPYLPRSKAG
jgi:putative transposase